MLTQDVPALINLQKVVQSNLQNVTILILNGAFQQGDPHVAGQVYIDNTGHLTVSAG